MKIIARVTRYSVVNDALDETTRNEETTVSIAHGYIQIGNCMGSMPLDRIDGAIERGGWYAQAGTKPVKVERTTSCDTPILCCGPKCQAGWGGRNYPEIFVPADQLRRVKELVPA